MPIPDNVAFAPNTKGEDILYSTVRNCQDDMRRIGYLKARLDDWFINHVEPLAKANSTFPLAVMTCIGIETIGQIFIKSENNNQNEFFVRAISKVDGRLSKKFNEDFKTKFKEMWVKEKEDESKIDTNAEMIYTFFRNTMIHGYKARGVYLDINENIKFEIKEGYLILNPIWFWGKFKICYENLFKYALNDTHRTEHKQCIEYIKKMIS